MDAFGHLNNIVYFRYFETARIHYFERCGFMATYEEDRIGAILHSTSCRFRRPLHFPDTVLAGARVTDLGEDRFTMGYRVASVAEEVGAAEGTGPRQRAKKHPRDGAEPRQSNPAADLTQLAEVREHARLASPPCSRRSPVRTRSS